MKLLVFSDTHFGFGSGTERETEAFDCVQEALRQHVDAVLIAGDLFDGKTPSSEILAKTMESLLPTVFSNQTARVTEGIQKDLATVPQLAFLGTPVITIAGNHERRAKGLLNPVQLLERAGFVFHLHGNALVLEKNSERVVIHGLSGLPNHLAPAVFKEWNPKPLPDAFNILLFHQTLTPLFFAPNGFAMDQLPPGFDLYLCGDIHEAKQATFDGKPLLVPGSVIHTQLGKDARERKKYWIIETQGKDCTIEPHEFEEQRDFYLIEDNVEAQLALLAAQKHTKKPLVRVKLPKNHPLPMQRLKEQYQEQFLLSFRHTEGKPIEETGVSLDDQRLSVQQLGKALLTAHFEKGMLDTDRAHQLFELLAEGKTEQAVQLLEQTGIRRTDLKEQTKG
ncbi:MAG: DNA repair exonuclease [Nanoarchaeota archaeon]|nr:DNA repair exonuclease [Nanoarchaeota archaeon]